MSQWNGTSFSLRVENIKHEKCIFLIGCISSSLHYFSITSLFQHVKLCVTIFLSMKSAMRNFTANLVERNSILTLSYRSTRSWSLSLYSTSSSVAFFLMQCKKSTFMFPMWPCISFAELWNSTEITWNAHNLADLRAQGVRIRNSLICDII